MRIVSEIKHFLRTGEKNEVDGSIDNLTWIQLISGLRKVRHEIGKTQENEKLCLIGKVKGLGNKRHSVSALVVFTHDQRLRVVHHQVSSRIEDDTVSAVGKYDLLDLLIEKDRESLGLKPFPTKFVDRKIGETQYYELSTTAFEFDEKLEMIGAYQAAYSDKLPPNVSYVNYPPLRKDEPLIYPAARLEDFIRNYEKYRPNLYFLPASGRVNHYAGEKDAKLQDIPAAEIKGIIALLSQGEKFS